MTSRRSTAAPFLAVLAIVLALAMYVGGYYSLGQSTEGIIDESGRQVIWRIYPRPWHWIFTPAAHVESLLRGCRVNCQEPPV
ncbi:MAG TPA: hypothetical protein VFB96_09080 [Pirellulaceae bacterium]|nr:hypothetical protein [Pirellulaceae bacterium]